MHWWHLGTSGHIWPVDMNYGILKSFVIITDVKCQECSPVKPGFLFSFGQIQYVAQGPHPRLQHKYWPLFWKETRLWDLSCSTSPYRPPVGGRWRALLFPHTTGRLADTWHPPLVSRPEPVLTQISLNFILFLCKKEYFVVWKYNIGNFLLAAL